MVDIKGLGIGPPPLVPQYRVATPVARKDGDGVESRPSPAELRSRIETNAATRGVVNSRAPLSEPLAERPPERQPDDSQRRLGNETRLALNEYLLQVFRDIGYPPSIAEAKAARLSGSVSFQTVAVASALDQRLRVLGFERGSFSQSVRLETADVSVDRGGGGQVTVDNLALRVEVRDETGFLLLSKQVNLKEQTPSGFGNPRGLPGDLTSLDDSPAAETGLGGEPADPLRTALGEAFGSDNLRPGDGADSYQIRINRVLASDQTFPTARADSIPDRSADNSGNSESTADTTAGATSDVPEGTDLPLAEQLAGAGLSLDA